VDIEGLESSVDVVSAGDGFACAGLENGKVRCWGDNDYGQLGNGTTTDSPVPVEVVGF
jgi:alpha-tubulin suppressor-like RCC1 family protein